ncbi:dihydroneopterin aldolase FolB [Psychroflexus torquis ATCC 700755]|uniref:7,8-dihydroneopterin aldolase n=1 Tax=Psychroflexus torquis (strain ATCC 700755 / CIP 106069 / ACAM 623) TaxID=313595 RepID=K4IDH6_PSYTT|nr:dihydroneopterin aldolase FolB [Psychroflexus torquis ATCC 700755]
MKVGLSLFKKPLDTINLNNIRVYAYHGCLPEETKIGSDYKVDISVDANLDISAESDELSDTVDYVHLNKIVKEEMAIASKLLEHVAKRILDRIFAELEIVKKAKVKVAKLNPPLGGDVEDVNITLSKKRG